MTVRRPVTAHDRTIVTVLVILCGTLLLALFGDQTPIVALVSSMWTLALTFWFRWAPHDTTEDL